MNISEFTVNSQGEEVTCWLVSPDPSKVRHDASLLLNISATRYYAIHDPSQNHPTQPFLDAGHHVLTFDLPHHGDRIVKDSIEETPPGAANGNIRAMSKAFAAGSDPFEQFVSDGMAAIDACIERGIALNGKIVGYGVSRAAYCLLRLAAADPRVQRRGRPFTRHRLGRPPRVRRSRRPVNAPSISTSRTGPTNSPTGPYTSASEARTTW